VELYYTGCSVGNIDHINKNCCKVRVQSSEYSESDSENSDHDTCSHDSDTDDHDEDDNDDRDMNLNVDVESDLSDIEIDILNLIDEMEIPEQIQPILDRCISEFFDTPLETAIVDFKRETLKLLVTFEN
jgi:hypothetical protein